uniref:Uncharacterized protein n=1 Tax=Knipowitschia caucasica TaxID=637954 RepID=A0AAV2JLV0_KNICA
MRAVLIDTDRTLQHASRGALQFRRPPSPLRDKSVCCGALTRWLQKQPHICITFKESGSDLRQFSRARPRERNETEGTERGRGNGTRPRERSEAEGTERDRGNGARPRERTEAEGTERDRGNGARPRERHAPSAASKTHVNQV